jgi:hypothetical protein
MVNVARTISNSQAVDHTESTCCKALIAIFDFAVLATVAAAACTYLYMYVLSSGLITNHGLTLDFGVQVSFESESVTNYLVVFALTRSTACRDLIFSE